MTVDGRIELVLTGSRTSEGAVEFDALLSFGDAFRKALRALVRSRSGLPAVQPGQPGADVREASSLRLTGLRAGSTVLELESLDPRIVADPVIDALQALADGLGGEQALEAPVIDLLRDAVQSLGERSSVGMSVPGRPAVESMRVAWDRSSDAQPPPHRRRRRGVSMGGYTPWTSIRMRFGSATPLVATGPATTRRTSKCTCVASLGGSFEHQARFVPPARDRASNWLGSNLLNYQLA